MSNDSDNLKLIPTDENGTATELSLSNGEPEFPSSVNGWTDVLDCRHPPYTDRTLEDNAHFARHVRKRYLLIRETDFQETDSAQ